MQPSTHTTKTERRNSEGGVFTTPLRYPGGKGRLGPWLAQVLRHNNISGGWYVEAYAGGAGAALHLLAFGYVDRIVINDLDPVVYSFWRSATEKSSSLIKKIRETPVNVNVWEEQRQIISNPQQHSILDVGFAAFFLNRTNRSGILHGGVIGGKNQDGPYKLDARYNIDSLVERIERISMFRQQISVTCLDAVDLLIDTTPGLPKNSLVYLDPPYYVKGSQLYRNHYTHDDHVSIAACVEMASYPVLVTYDDCPEIESLYSKETTCRFSLHYSTHEARPKASEILIYKNLDLPCIPELTRSAQLPQQARTKLPKSSQNATSR